MPPIMWYGIIQAVPSQTIIRLLYDSILKLLEERELLRFNKEYVYK